MADEVARQPQAASYELIPELVVAEYQSLRTEILKLIELQYQLITLVILAFGTIVSIGVQSGSNQIILVQPLLSLILGLSWLSHAHGIHRCASYLRIIEERMGPENLGWESYVRKTPVHLAWLGFWGVRAIFSITAVLAVVVYFLMAMPKVDVLFSTVSALTAVATIAVFVGWREQA